MTHRLRPRQPPRALRWTVSTHSGGVLVIPWSGCPRPRWVTMIIFDCSSDGQARQLQARMPDHGRLFFGHVLVTGDMTIPDQRNPPGPSQLANAVGANGLDEGFQLGLFAGDLDHHLLGTDVDAPAADD